MLISLYKRILGKLQLNGAQLQELRGKLSPSNICAHSFVRGGKMCPNTTALAIKLDRPTFGGSREVKGFLRQYGITGWDLMKFYIVYDIPSIFSRKLFNRSLEKMRQAVDDMLTTF